MLVKYALDDLVLPIRVQATETSITFCVEVSKDHPLEGASLELMNFLHLQYFGSGTPHTVSTRSRMYGSDHVDAISMARPIADLIMVKDLERMLVLDPQSAMVH